MGCFSSPKTTMQSTIDPAAKSGVYDPLVQQLAQQLFGTSAKTTTTYGSIFDKLFGRGTTTTTPGTQGAFTGSDPSSWAYQGQRVAEPTALQNQTYNWAGSLQPNAVDFTGLQNQATNVWNRSIVPSIMERMAGMDTASSGGTADALARAGSDLTTNLFAQMAPLALQQNQQNLQSLGLLGDIGNQQYGQAQNQLAAQQQQWTESQPWNHPLMQLLFPALQGGQQTPVQQSGGLGYSALTGFMGSSGGSNMMAQGLNDFGTALPYWLGY